MKKPIFSVVLIGVFASITAFYANKAPYNIGDTVSDFSLKNIEGKTVSLANHANAKGFIVVFTCNHCPFARAYEDRIEALHKKYAPQGFPVIAINPSDASVYDDETVAKIQERAKEKGFTFPYLIDDSQTVAKVFGASRTPHVFVLNRENGGVLKMAYIGTIDDNSQDATGVSKRYVEEAVNNLLTGKPVITNSTKAVGCAIKWKNA